MTQPLRNRIHDPERSILAALWRPMDEAKIAQLTGLSEALTATTLGALRESGMVYERMGLWGKVKDRNEDCVA